MINDPHLPERDEAAKIARKAYPYLPLKIDVLPDDISNGVRGDPSLCPVARATARLFPEDALIEVDGEDIWVFYVEGEVFQYALPSEARDFTINFDKDLPVGPLSFTTWRVPPEILLLPDDLEGLPL